MRLFAGTPFARPPVCDRCGRPESECQCPPIAVVKPLIPAEKQMARLAIEKRKKGKLVTAIRGLSAEGNDLPALLTKLKSACGAGGNLDGETLEIQGNHLERLRMLLADIGYRVSG
jgi:translation initiation factor 1